MPRHAEDIQSTRTITRTTAAEAEEKRLSKMSGDQSNASMLYLITSMTGNRWGRALVQTTESRTVCQCTEEVQRSRAKAKEKATKEQMDGGCN